MENQHRLIRGYRELSEAEIAAMNKLKALGLELQGAIGEAAIAGADARSLAVATTHLQTGMMWAVRAVAKPEGF